MKLTPNARLILEKRYLKKENGVVVETPEEMFRRVAKTVAGAEKIFHPQISEEELIQVEEKFFTLMTDLDFLPNTPTLINAGRELGQLSACFVIPVGDSMEEIFTAVHDAALIHKSGGGTGFSFSSLRPKNSLVRTTGGLASGPVSFMKVFNAATEAIRQGGVRRGANMGILRVDHPDILEFIKAKEEEGALRNFNLSVGLTREFLQALRSGGEYELKFGGKLYRKLLAREVFSLIVSSAWANGEPGIVFLDRLNEANPTPALGEIEATNPCVTGDTWVTTAAGPRQVYELVGRPFEAVVNGQPYCTTEEGFFKTGTKAVVRLETREGFKLRLTADHYVLRVVDRTRYRLSAAWVPVKELKPGDKVLLHNHRQLTSWPGELSENEGYLLGLLVGDGVLKKETAVLSVWAAGEQVVHGLPAGGGATSVMQLALEHVHMLPHRADLTGGVPVQERGEFRSFSVGFKKLAERMGMQLGKKTITPEIERASSDGYRGFLRGLFDGDGSVQGSQKKGVSIRLAQSDLEFLRTVQRMLLRLGIASTIYQERRPAASHAMPDRKGGTQLYRVKAQHELVITGDNLALFAERIGFGHSGKARRLELFLRSFRRRMNRERFMATVSTVEDDGASDVYDVHVPGVGAFDANGFCAHNCGEQPLLPYEACNLGSINLAQMAEDGEINWEKLEDTVRWAMRFLDNVVEVNRFPLPQITEMVRGNRKVGLGVMGWADLLFKLRIPYASEEALKLAHRVMGEIQRIAHQESAELAKMRGDFPNIEKSIYAGKKMRNATCTTIAPTGTISMVAGVSSGIEPAFSLVYTKTVLEGESLLEVNPIFEAYVRKNFSQKKAEEIIHRAKDSGSVKDIPEIPQEFKDIFMTALEIAPEWHVRMQAAFQDHVDNAVSKTVNFPSSATREDVAKVYQLAYELGCKGVTVYRTGSREEEVLVKGEKEKRALSREDSAGGKEAKIYPRPRPKRTIGVTEQVKTGCGKMYITVNFDEEGMLETFITTGSAGGCPGFAEGVSRLVSMALRANVAPEAIIDQLTSVSCPNFLRRKATDKELVGKSCPDIIGKVLASELTRQGKSAEELARFLEDNMQAVVSLAEENCAQILRDLSAESLSQKGICPECGGKLIFQEGCVNCRGCGFSKCS